MNARIFEGRFRGDMDLVSFIYKLLFNWNSIRAGFYEIEWYVV